MKKVLALMLVAVLCITSVFALDFSFGYMPLKYDGEMETFGEAKNFGQYTKATLSQDIGNIEIGVSFATPAPVKFVKKMINTSGSISDRFSAAKDEISHYLSYSKAEANILFNVVNSKVVKLGFGVATGLNGITQIGDGLNELYLDAVAKFTLNISSHFGIFASAGIEALKVDFDAEAPAQKVVPIWGEKAEILDKVISGLTVGFTAGF